MLALVLQIAPQKCYISTYDEQTTSNNRKVMSMFEWENVHIIQCIPIHLDIVIFINAIAVKMNHKQITQLLLYSKTMSK